MTSDIVDERTAEQIVSACRTAIGDHVRSITYFTPEDFEQLYLRSDLEQNADLTGFVDYESLGFEASTAYRGSELGDYGYTIRIFENGYLLRIIEEEEGVFVTTDGLTLQNFREVATAVRAVLTGD